MHRKKIVGLLRLSFSIGLLVLLYCRVDASEVSAVFGSMRIWPLLGFFLLLFVNTGISTFKWALLLRADGVRMPFLSLFASYLVGSFFNLFLPSNIGGDAYRIYDVARYSKRTAHSFASVLADRVSGYLALAMLASGFGLLGMGYLPHKIIVLMPLGGLFALLLLIGMSFNPDFLLRILGMPIVVRIYDIRPFVSKLLDSIQVYRSSPMLFLTVMLASFLFQILAAFSIFLLALGLQIPVTLFVMLVYVPFVSILEAVPITIFGLGIRDASYTYFLAHAGVPDSQALTLPLAYVVLTLIYVSLGGVIFLLRPHVSQSGKG
jgi:glycosyltransferase 2 family protein